MRAKMAAIKLVPERCMPMTTTGGPSLQNGAYIHRGTDFCKATALSAESSFSNILPILYGDLRTYYNRLAISLRSYHSFILNFYWRNNIHKRTHNSRTHEGSSTSWQQSLRQGLRYGRNADYLQPHTILQLG